MHLSKQCYKLTIILSVYLLNLSALRVLCGFILFQRTKKALEAVLFAPGTGAEAVGFGEGLVEALATREATLLDHLLDTVSAMRKHMIGTAQAAL